MKRGLIRITVFASLVLLLLSCGGKARVIPKGKMAQIYAEMFMADQWIDSNPQTSRTADTSFVYEAIFQKYGYDSDDYRASVDHYIQDPDRFARILRETASLLEKDIIRLKAKLKEQIAAEPDFFYEFDFDRLWMFEDGLPRMLDRDSLQYYQDREGYFILDLKPMVERPPHRPMVFRTDVGIPE